MRKAISTGDRIERMGAFEMNILRKSAAAWIGIGLSLGMSACGGSNSTFPPPPTVYFLTVDSTTPASGVAVTVSPADNNGAANETTSFTRAYNSGSTVTLTAPATSGGNNFSSWTGCATASTVTCNVTMSADTTVTANYSVSPPTVYVLTVNSTTPASGVAVTVSPADNNGAANGTTSFTRSYNSGASVTLTAPATSGGNNFTSWTGCTSSNGATCTVAMNANTTVTANYAVPVTYVLTVNSTSPASGVAITVSPADNTGSTNGTTSFTRSYNSGSSVTLTAPATSGSNTFTSWTGCTSSSGATCTVAMNANTTVTANYAVPVTYVLTVNSTSPASGVAVTVSPADNTGSTNGTTSFTRTYNAAASVTLTAPATSGSNTFTSWTGCTSSSGAACTVAMSANTTVTANYAVPVTYVLTVNSTTPASGVAITVSPADNNGATNGTTSFTRTYNAAASVTLTAPATSGGNIFFSWTGCTTASTVTCNVTMSANTTVTANYTLPPITVAPNAATIGTQVQFLASISGTATTAVTWSLTPSGSASGTLSATGLYTTPYPAPATVTVTATSTQNTAQTGSVVVTLSQPATAAGPALTVNVGAPGNPISPLIYGMDAYLLHGTAADTAAVAPTNITVDRWGGDSTERYNYLLDVTNDISDWFFENSTGNSGDGWPAVSGVKAFDALVESNNANGIKTLGTVPVLGWVAKDSISCSFPRATYPNQLAVKDVNGTYYAFDPYGGVCGAGVYPVNVSGCTSTGGCNIPSDPTVTSTAAPPPAPPAASAVTAAWADATWTGGWVNYLVNKFGAGNSGMGVAIYDLDNEPSWWSSGSFDVHPNHFTYDEVTNGGIGTALAIKTVDPTAQVSGPVMDYWWAYFYSMEDIRNGWNTVPCYEAWSHPADRTAHGGLPFIQYYLSQFAQAETTYGIRLLDYVDLHTYFAPQYPTNSGNSVAFTTAGDTGAQQARLNSTRVFWDPTYTDPDTHIAPAYGGYQQPNYFTDPNYTTSCTAPAQAPQLIPMMKAWVTGTAGSYAGYFYPGASYPGTKTAIDEYNWGGMEAINGALAQADILGIFGREGLDLGTMWPTTDPSKQIPGMMAFQIYRNYDGANSTFGDTVLPSTSAKQGQLSVYGAIHTTGAATGTATVMVINKTYGSLTSTVSLAGLSSTVTTAQAYLYSNGNLAAIVAQPAVTVTPGTGGAASTIANYSFPAQSITLFVVP